MGCECVYGYVYGCVWWGVSVYGYVYECVWGMRVSMGYGCVCVSVCVWIVCVCL